MAPDASDGSGPSKDTSESSSSTNDSSGSGDSPANGDGGSGSGSGAPKRSGGGQSKRGSRGGQHRRGGQERSRPDGDGPVGGDARNDVELPEKISEGRASKEAAEKALVKRPRIGDTMPVPTSPPPSASASSSKSGDADGGSGEGKKKRRRGGRGGGNGGGQGDGSSRQRNDGQKKQKQSDGGGQKKKGRGRGRGRGKDAALDEALLEQRKGRERDGKPIGRYFMCVQVRPGMAQVAVLEGRSLIEHYVSRPADDVAQIHGNIYVGKVQNVLPGMEAAFVDITTPKNAVLYRGDVQYDPEDIEVKGKNPRIEDILKNKQLILCQVTKNPIAHKGARLTQEVSLPGRFVVLIPNSKTYGISKRLPDDVRKRLRNILDRVKPDQHGLIVRTAAEHATEDELVADMTILLKQWDEIEKKAAKAQRPTLLSREPELAVRVIREEFSADYRGVMIDDKRLYEEVRDYVQAFNPELADRIEYYDADKEGLSLFERFHVHEQVHKALDRKVWLPSGGSLIIEHTEALTVIDVNTGKNVGKSNLEETVFHNNMEAAEEVAKQLRLRDIGGIIVIDFIDMEIKENRAKVAGALRDALARDKTRSQVFDVGELGLVEMTRKRIGEGLLTEYSEICPDCDGRGVRVDFSMLE
ncbi:Rne/Rng family ribonuclease [Ilumatobacter coccineus]|uniref:Ribonuclease n=1 Tax=Ilumatobacter coccineus (strain NBRC 103263 / KCTC 29153 / YM16-304) TaxID=1313172 RepID=A0A6C7EBY9_ILUCY|nr:Rne/Rng family ribonuclease [Ilumatobacter coccineus]BAN02158.1 ribonuclease [Ilumatobacter coccineus YM16-304]